MSVCGLALVDTDGAGRALDATLASGEASATDAVLDQHIQVRVDGKGNGGEALAMSYLRCLDFFVTADANLADAKLVGRM
jgi:hypothetical protein